MTEPDSDVMLDATGATDGADWLARMRAIAEDGGTYQPLGPVHHALFIANGPTLLVTFDSYATARSRPKQLPVGLQLADQCDWSHLCLLSDADLWFRDANVYRHFDHLIDAGFFERFDRVLFYGAGAAGYAAAAFSVASPGARLLLINPVATLAPALAGWDTRHRACRRLDFTSRYGFAPDMVEAALEATVIVDPTGSIDAMHAALFHAPHVRQFSARFGGPYLEASFARSDILHHLIAAAVEGSLTASRFGQLWRKRRDDLIYLRQLQAAVAAHPAREAMLCRNVVARLNRNRFKKRLADLTGKG